jgi:hypothetical protein
VRSELTRDRLRRLMQEIARTAPARRAFRVFFVGGATAVYLGFRPSSIDADLWSADDGVFRDVQDIKERVDVNVEFARPEQFVPPLEGSEGRHLLVKTLGRVSFFHYDPYAQALSKIVRGLERDLVDARAFIAGGLVEPGRLRALVKEIPGSVYAKYPTLSREAVEGAVETFLRKS